MIGINNILQSSSKTEEDKKIGVTLVFKLDIVN